MNNPDEDLKHLSLLATFHYVLGGVTAFFACIPLIHVAMGFLMLLFGIFSNEFVPAFFSLIFIFMGGFFSVMGWTLAACMIFTGRNLNRKTHYKFCFALACVECIFMPFGTVLGVLTIIVLSRDSVKKLFSEKAAP